MKCVDINNLKSLQSLVRKELDSLETELQWILRSKIPFLEDICGYIRDVPGKRLRPTVLFLSARSTGGKYEDMVAAGFAIELIHTATLIHDDIIDGHRVRRGNPTIFAKYGNEVATIMGDYLYSKAFACLGEAGLFEIMELLSRVTHIMSIGELMQYQQRRDINVSEARYMDMISKKTASLFSASCECGAVLGSNGNGWRNSYSGFGESIGLAFQITDDLCDYVAVDEDIGKPTASDFTEGRVTLPFITSFRNAPDRVKKRVSDLFHLGIDGNEHWNEVVSFVRNYGGVEYSLQKAKNLGEKAKVSLMNIDPSPEKDALFLTVDYVVNRVNFYSG
jgi:octaprenyl-diphosphate synthase